MSIGATRDAYVQLYIQPAGWKDFAFEKLKSEAAEIEKQLGAPLQWRALPEKDSSRIMLEEKIDPKDPANRQKVCDWFATWTPKMYLAFQDRVKKLSPPE